MHTNKFLTSACAIAGHSQVPGSVGCPDRNVQRRGMYYAQHQTRILPSCFYLHFAKHKTKRFPHQENVIYTLCALHSQHKSDRFTAMGTIQNLTRCKQVLPLLCQTAVITDAVIPILNASGSVRTECMFVGVCVRVCVCVCLKAFMHRL
jgi:hypothetical protein